MPFSMNDECGIVGIYGHPEASNLAYLCLYALQHRGQESAGIVSSDGRMMYSHRDMGLVQDVFNRDIIARLKGHMAIGHTRYSTTGQSLLRNCQPFAVDSSRCRLALAHNGNFVNSLELREELESRGAIFQSTMDTEVIAHLMASVHSGSLAEKMMAALVRGRGAFSMVFLTDRQVAACRDPWGFRPLSIGRLDGAYVIVSETCALDLIEAEFEREIEPGEIVIVDENGLQSMKPFLSRRLAPCVFEHIYFARPDSVIFGQNVHQVRLRLGGILAREHPVDADLVISVPDSGRSAALGFSRGSGTVYEDGLVRNHYVGRTFIEPAQSIRHFGVKIKLNAVRAVLEGKRIVVVDDSIVRGTTCKKIVSMLRELGGAKEVHVRISSPPVTHPCFYGVDTPTKEELAYNEFQGDIGKIRDFIGADTLGYISIEGVREAVADPDSTYCEACFTGDYPVDFLETAREKQINMFFHEVERR